MTKETLYEVRVHTRDPYKLEKVYVARTFEAAENFVLKVHDWRGQPGNGVITKIDKEKVEYIDGQRLDGVPVKGDK